MTPDFLDVSSWHVLSVEPEGANAKVWLAAQPGDGLGDAWLWKPSRSTTPGRAPHWTDHLSEVIVSALARLLGVPCAEAQLARRDGQPGSLSRSVVPRGWDSLSGDLLLSDLADYVPMSGQLGVPPARLDRSGYTLDNILTVLDQFGGPPGSLCAQTPAPAVFAGFLVLDAWTANTDRHAQNRMVLESIHGDRRLAPTFDHGSALGAGMDDAARARQADRIEIWCGRGRARSFVDEPVLVDLAHDSVMLTGSDGERWLERLGQVRDPQVQDILGSIPALSGASRTFISTVLIENRRRLMA